MGFWHYYVKDDQYLTSISACTAVANALGRPSWGFLCDRLSFNVSRMSIFVFFAHHNPSFVIVFFPMFIRFSSPSLYCTSCGHSCLPPSLLWNSWSIRRHSMRAGSSCCSSSCPATMFSFKALLAGYTEKHIYRQFMGALDYVDSMPGSLGSRLAALADFAECVCCWE